MNDPNTRILNQILNTERSSNNHLRFLVWLVLGIVCYFFAWEMRYQSFKAELKDAQEEVQKSLDEYFKVLRSLD